MTKFVEALDNMNDARQAHRVSGELAIAGVLTRTKMKGTFDGTTGETVYDNNEKPEVFSSDTATIQSGAWVVRTEAGCLSHKRQKTDKYVYIPFRAARGISHCVMKIDQLLLVRLKGMSWRGEEARIAVGTLWDRLAIREGAGLEVTYNDDPTRGACCVPRVLYLSAAKKAKGRRIAVYLRQVHCPCAFYPGPPGETFITVSKMGFHGRRDLLVTGSDVRDGDSDDEDDATEVE